MRRAPGSAFTILEVLIALVVLVVGVLGVVALVPASVHTAGETVDQLTLADHAASITAALRLGARDHTYEVWRDVAGTRSLAHAFLLLPHPAAVPVGQPMPPALRADGTADPAIFAHPACLLLPVGVDGVDRMFVYPRAEPPIGAGIAAENGQGDVLLARDDGARPAGEPLVRAVYGNAAFGADGRPLPGYAFALAIQRARVDGVRRDGLYTVTILFFKAFRTDPGAEPSRPIAVYTTELMAGPLTLPGGG